MNSTWEWSRLRRFGIGLRVWPLDWWPLWQFFRHDDQHGGEVSLIIGPVELLFSYNEGPTHQPEGGDNGRG